MKSTGGNGPAPDGRATSNGTSIAPLCTVIDSSVCAASGVATSIASHGTVFIFQTPIARISKRPVVALVGRLKRRNVAAAHLSFVYQITRAPGKPGRTVADQQQIGHRPGMAAVAIRIRVNADQTVVKAGGDPLQRIRALPDLYSNILAQVLQRTEPDRYRCSSRSFDAGPPI